MIGCMGKIGNGYGHLVGSLAVAGLLLFVGGCSGIDSGIEYPSDLPEVDSKLSTPEGEGDPSVSLGTFKIRPEVCQGIDTHPITQKISQDDFTRFLETQGAKVTPTKARGNLYWYDFPNQKENGFVRLRLAVSEDPSLSAKYLHDSLLEHGPGWWGLRRSNLAILAPKASLREGLAFAIKHKLVCWGMFTLVGNDDAYVVPGPYTEL
jgi:hypothetical protein